MGTVNGISKSGVNLNDDLSDGASEVIIDIGANQTFQVTEVIVTNTHSSEYAYVRIFDVADPAVTAALQKIPDIIVPPLETVRLPFSDGPKFYTEVSAELEGGTGTVAKYNCQVNGVMF